MRTGEPLPGATVIPLEYKHLACMTDALGMYELDLPTDVNITVRFSFVGYSSVERAINLKPGEGRTVNVRLEAGVTLAASEIIADGDRTKPVRRLDPSVATRIPSPRGTIEDLLLQAPVNFTSELSSGYNVRGGSFDENLVYVNNIEVYRPFLVRAGQQEGLSFPNPDMVDDITFSAGGFESRYGDKLSSVLDIQYRKPSHRRTRVSASFLGAQVQRDGLSEAGPDGYSRFTFNTGFRYRDNSYVLGSLDEGGEYKPRYIDLQSFITWDPDGYGPWDIELLTMYGQNDYNFIPATRETNVGNINEALKLTIHFDGQEMTSFQTGFGAFSANRTTEFTRWKFIASAFKTHEQERFDILGAYYLDELDRDIGSDELGDVLVNRGVGAFLNHARNELDATVLSGTAKGSAVVAKQAGREHFFEWGVKGQIEIVDDVLREWSLVDSAGFISPHPRDSIGYIDRPPAISDQIISLDDVVIATNHLRTNRFTAYFQDSWGADASDGSRWDFNIGARLNYGSTNGQLVAGPRGHISWTPAGADTASVNSVWSLAAGMYWQPPFYREMRGFDGALNLNLEAQLATHFVLGMDRMLELYGRPFKLVSELYYKDLSRLVPYEIENVRQRYYAQNMAEGYAAGIDVMLNGEFIDGVQSWMRLSAMHTQEDIIGDDYWQFSNAAGETIVPGFTWDDVAVDSVSVDPGFIPRPTDQRVNVSLLFQDEMPGNDAYKVLVSLFFGTGLPFGPPTHERYRDILRTPAYRRVDIGFSRELFTAKPTQESPTQKSGFISIEVFNVLGIRNTINHTWIEDVNGRMYAIPNYLTDRRLNLKVGIAF